MTFNTPSGTRGVSQPGFFTRFLKMFNKYSAGRIRKTGVVCHEHGTGLT